MLQDFINKVREEGKLRIVYGHKEHQISKTVISPIIIKESDCQIGILFQDKASGDAWMLELDSKDSAIAFIESFTKAMNDALNTFNILDESLKERIKK